MLSSMYAGVLPTEAVGPRTDGFQWLNLIVLTVVLIALWPAYRALSRRISRNRIERWAREEGWEDGIPPGADGRPGNQANR